MTLLHLQYSLKLLKNIGSKDEYKNDLLLLFPYIYI